MHMWPCTNLACDEGDLSLSVLAGYLARRLLWYVHPGPTIPATPGPTTSIRPPMDSFLIIAVLYATYLRLVTFQGLMNMAAAAAAQPAVAQAPDGGPAVRLSPTYVLRRRHVEGALMRAPADARDVTVWIHNSTLGIEKNCFLGMKCVSRILVWGQPHDNGTPSPVVAAAVLRELVKKLRAYEPALVDHIHELVATHMGNDGEMHRVGSSAFQDCSELREVVLPQSITDVGTLAFWKCTSLTSVTLPDSLTQVGSYAFYDCTSLTSVNLPNSVTHLGTFAFRDCTSLTSVTLSESLTHIGDKALCRCIALREVVLPQSTTHICSQVFYDCTSLTSVTLPDSLVHIGSHAFYGCTSLTALTLPDSLTHIGAQAFRGCSSLTSVVLPDSLTHIGAKAFFECTTLSQVTMPAVRPLIGARAFHFCPSLPSAP
jgi:hypothetical protein